MELRIENLTKAYGKKVAPENMQMLCLSCSRVSVDTIRVMGNRFLLTKRFAGV